MKKITITAGILLSLIVSCNNTDSLITKDTESTVFIPKSTIVPYTSQLPYITVEDMAALQQFDDTKSIYTNIEDATVSWQYFDGLYNESLAGDIKENIGYIILAKKDLIALVNQYQADPLYSDALKKYVDILIDEEYIGYTTLYYALDAIKNVDSQFASERAKEILRYAAGNNFHSGIIQDGDVDQATLAKITSDYNILESMKTL